MLIRRNRPEPLAKGSGFSLFMLIFYLLPYLTSGIQSLIDVFETDT